ncbi:MAG: hypothetical protein CFH35_01377, partial [Alphaproteobacteria bacterium MarineAlpha9_Bin5]
DSDNYASAVELAEVPEQIRGFGHIKLEAIEAADQGRAVIFEKIRAITRQDRAA